MKQLLKSLRTLLMLTGLGIGTFLALNYHADIPVETIREKYAYDDAQFLELDGYQVHYRQVGQGMPLVLVHGFGANLRNWEAWTTLLKDSFQVISLDLAGYGITGPKEGGDYSTKGQVAFLNRFVQQLHLDTFYLAGNSMGGNIAWNYATSYPDQVKKLVLLNASGLPATALQQNGAKEKKLIRGFQLLKMPFAKYLITKISPRSVIAQTVRDTYANPDLATQTEIDIYFDMQLRAGNRSVLVERMNMPKPDNSAQLKTLRTPTLILWGDKDKLVDVGYAYAFEQLLPNAQLIVYENVGHSPMIEIPERSAKDLRRFLNQ